jgi:hypothetical protein
MSKNKKRQNEKIFTVLIFSQNQFLKEMTEVFPLFLSNSWTDRAQIFFPITSAKLGCAIFFLLNVASIKFGSLYKTCAIEKNMVFDGVFSILLLLTCENGMFSRKKHAPQMSPSCHKKVSLRKKRV